MFTGIVTDVGRVEAITDRGDRVFRLATRYAADTIGLGASIACAGVCLTVIDKGPGMDESPGWFAISASSETLGRTTLQHWQLGTLVNLERALKVGDELGGHLVTGHVDGLAVLVSREAVGASLRLAFRVPEPLARFIAPKGSVALDGVSLTVNEVEGAAFAVNIIPHTAEQTTLGGLQPGTPVNLEVDLIARYLGRLLEKE